MRISFRPGCFKAAAKGFFRGGSGSMVSGAATRSRVAGNFPFAFRSAFESWMERWMGGWMGGSVEWPVAWNDWSVGEC